MSNISLESATEVKRPDFGSGRYSKLMNSSWENAQVVFGMSSEVAERLARQIGSDFGAAIRNAPVEAKIGKSVNSDGKVSLSEAAKVKGITVTDALLAMRALQFATEAGKFGFLWSHTKWSVTEEMEKKLARFE